MAVLLFLALLFSSRFPVLWLSTELLCGGFLSLVAAGVVAGWPSWIVGSLLALFGLCKPDALLPCLAMAGYLLWRGRGWPQRAGLLAGLLGAAGALVVPAFLVHGLRLFGGRAFLSFGQHYSALFALHQLQPPENPWRDWQVYVGAIFPGATSVWDVVHLHPRKYADFVALSVLYGARKFVTVMNLFLVLLVQRLLSLRRQATALEPFEGILGVSLVGVVPWLLVSFPHVRYFARYYPLLLLSGLHFAEQLEPAGRRRAYALAAAGVAVNCLLLLLDARTRPGSFLLWLPD